MLLAGAVASGTLKWLVDPMGTAIESINGVLFPDSGITLPHAGAYAIVALSGSPFVDPAEYSSAQSNTWQRQYSAEATAINIAAAAADVIGVSTSFLSAATHTQIDIAHPQRCAEEGPASSSPNA